MRHSPPMESHCHQSCLHCNVSSLPVAQVLHKCHPAITWSQLCQIKHIFVSTFLCVSVHGCMHVHVYMAINSLILSIGPNHNLYWSHMIFTVPQTWVNHKWKRLETCGGLLLEHSFLYCKHCQCSLNTSKSLMKETNGSCFQNTFFLQDVMACDTCLILSCYTVTTLVSKDLNPHNNNNMAHRNRRLYLSGKC